jgi:hypothetical protein
MMRLMDVARMRSGESGLDGGARPFADKDPGAPARRPNLVSAASCWPSDFGAAYRFRAITRKCWAKRPGILRDFEAFSVGSISVSHSLGKKWPGLGR